MTREQRKKQLMQHVAVFIVVVLLLLIIPVRLIFSKRAPEENSASSQETASVSEQGGTAGRSGSQKADPAQSEASAQDPDEAGNTAGSENIADRGASADSADTADNGDTIAGSDTESGVSAGSSAESAASGQSAEEDEGTIRDTLEEKTQEAVIRAKEIEEERNKPTEEELRQQERDRLSAMDLDELTAYLWEHEVPADLIYFMEEYPETREFVTDYLYQPDTPPSKSIAGEVRKGTIPHFLQWDERWGYETYGSTFMAVSGCGPTALSEVYSGLTGKTDMNPFAMAQWAEENGFYVYGSGTSWEMMTTGAWMLGLNAWSLDGGKESLIAALQSGYPVICAMTPGDFTFFGHFIVLTAVDENENVRVLDSNSRIRTQKLWNVDDLMWQIAGMWAFSYDG